MRRGLRGRGSVALLAVLLATGPVAASNWTPWLLPEPADRATAWGVLDFDRARGSAPPWSHAHSLTGSWGGWRTELEDVYGVFVVGAYTSEVAGNPVGGQTQGVKYTHNVGLALVVDLEKFAGIPNSRFVASASNRAGS